MATQEEFNQITLDNRTALNSIATNSKLQSELANQTSITSANDFTVIQNGTSDAKKAGVALLRGSLGGWNASTNAPSLVNGTGIGGDKYIVTTAGSQDFGAGSITFLVDDFVEYINGAWERTLNTATGAVAVNGVVTINSASDFPDAVGGVIELAPTPGVELTYVLGVDEIDVGSDEFMNTGGDIVIIGTHRTASGITSTTSNALFTSVDGFLSLEFFGVTAPSAKIIEFTTPVATFKSFVTNNFIVRDCDTIGTIDGAFTTSLRTMTVITTQTGGLLWTGTDSSQINISNMLGIDWTGTLLDLGTATFDIIDIGGGNRFISPSGTTILSGAAASANITSTGRGIVDNNLFNGLGTALSGIDTEDLKWTFNDNVFVDNTTKNTEVITDTFLTSSQTVTIGTIGLYVAIGGANWGSDIAKRFTISTAGVATYIGLETIDVAVGGTATVSKVGGGSDVICTKMAKNGTVSDKTLACTENSAPTGIASQGLFELETGDTMQMFVGNEDSTSNIVVDASSMIISKR
jgi:hypothetical protein